MHGILVVVWANTYLQAFFSVGQRFFVRGSCRRNNAAIPVWLHPQVLAGRNKVQLSSYAYRMPMMFSLRCVDAYLTRTSGLREFASSVCSLAAYIDISR